MSQNTYKIHFQKTKKSPPFIIWTLQRTGGTNLAHKLIRKSGLKKTQDEPFNKKRELGYITCNWLEEGDKSKLKEHMEEVCKSQRCIKHCVEQVPWEISEELARQSLIAGYKHLFLYRKNPLNRLLSMEYARRTGVWGPSHIHKAEKDNLIFEKPLNINRLCIHEKRCSELLYFVWNLLLSNGATPMCLAYEEIYGEDYQLAKTKIINVLSYLGIHSSNEENINFVHSVRKSGNQGTSDRYSFFIGQEELSNRLKKINCFNPSQAEISKSYTEFEIYNKVMNNQRYEGATNLESNKDRRMSKCFNYVNKTNSKINKFIKKKLHYTIKNSNQLDIKSLYKALIFILILSGKLLLKPYKLKHVVKLTILRLYAQKAMQENIWRSAERHWQEIFNICEDQTPVEAYIELGKVRRYLRNYDASEKILEIGLEKYSKCFKLQEEYAEVATAKQNWSEAIKRWKRVIENFNNVPVEPYLQLLKAINFYLQQRNINFMEEKQLRHNIADLENKVYDMASKGSNDACLILELAELALIQNDFKQAEHQLTKFIYLSNTIKISQNLVIRFCVLCNNNNFLKLKDEFCQRFLVSYSPKNLIEILSKSSNSRVNYNDISSKALLKGQSNHGIWIHKTQNNKIVEKITTRYNEKIVYKHILSLHESITEIVPYVYNILEHHNINIIYMEYIRRKNEYFQLNDYFAECISNTILIFQGFLQSIPELKYSKPVNQNKLLSYLDIITKQAYLFNLDIDNKILYNNIDENFFSVWNQKYVASHGDLHFNNMSINLNLDKYKHKIKIFDFGLCKMYPVGYEFHHFIRMSFIYNNFNKFVYRMIEFYAKKNGYDIDQLYLNALIFAILRSLFRLTQKLHDKTFFTKELSCLTTMIDTYTKNKS